jgi:riboflavin transporter
MNKSTKNIARSSLFLAIAIVFQFLGRSLPQISQIFVGPAVNTVLILAAAICGIWWGVAVGSLTPLLAWLLGQLPAAFGPFIPFIMLGNAIFVIIFCVFKPYKKFGEAVGIIVGSFIKFLFLYISASKLIILLNLGINVKVAQKLTMAMGIIQLITALAGGIIALIIIKLLKDRRQI